MMFGGPIVDVVQTDRAGWRVDATFPASYTPVMASAHLADTDDVQWMLRRIGIVD